MIIQMNGWTCIGSNSGIFNLAPFLLMMVNSERIESALSEDRPYSVVCVWGRGNDENMKL